MNKEQRTTAGFWDKQQGAIRKSLAACVVLMKFGRRFGDIAEIAQPLGIAGISCIHYSWVFLGFLSVMALFCGAESWDNF